MNKIIYTAIFGPYDDLKDPNVITPGWRYICYTDQPLKSKTWEIIHRQMLPEGAQRTSRYYKIMFHRHIDAEFSMWIDGSFIINCDLNEWWKRFRDPVTFINHPFRSCVYKEIEACIEQHKDSAYLLKKQEENYRHIGMPDHHGMVATGVIMRKACQPVFDLCDLWYQQLQLYSVRDQVGLAFALWRQPIHHLIEWNYGKDKEFIHVKHLHKRLVL